MRPNHEKMESLEAEAVPSRSGEADAPEPSDCERQRCRRGRMSMHQRDDQHRGNAELRRSARSRQMPDERDAWRRDDGQSRRSARSRQTSAERDARRQEDTERRRTARRARQDASRPDWAHLRVHACPSPRAVRLGAAHLCSHCRAWLLWGDGVPVLS